MTPIAVLLTLCVVVAVVAVAVVTAAVRRAPRPLESGVPAGGPDTATVDAVNQAVTTVMAQADQRMGERLDRSERELGHLAQMLGQRVEDFDHVITERVGGVRDVVDSRMAGVGQTISTQVQSMGAELQRLQSEVTRMQSERARQHGELQQSLQETIAGQRRLTDTTSHLREALASPKARGQWGERMADDVLRIAGFLPDVNYRKQTQLAGGTTPDFTFLMPGDRQLHMDVKFPVDNYLRYLEADRDDDRDRLASQFLRDVRNRVRELTSRGYADPEHTLGFLLLFIPNESVYGFIHERDPQLIDQTMSDRVVLCSPTTLFAMLAVIRRQVDAVATERASDEILRTLASFGEQWQKLSDQIDKVERHAATLTNSVGELAGPRRRALNRQLAHVDDIRTRAGLVSDDESELILGEKERPALREVSGN